MARIRTIKPEFFTSDDICGLSLAARLLYIGTWCEADREGRLEWKPRSFKRRYLPDDDVDIDALCNELVDAGLIVLYGDSLAVIPTFGKHQHINPRESTSSLDSPPNLKGYPVAKITTDIRAEVMHRDGSKCVRCGSTNDLTLDHLLPQSAGGPHVPENLRVMCRACNSARPVAGPGLDADLEKEGFTLKSLFVRFGIDASPRVATRAIHELDVQVGREGKEGKGKEHASTTRVKKTPLNESFTVSERVKTWAIEKGHSRLSEHLDAFKAKAKANGYTYADWDSAFMEAIRNDWAKLSSSPSSTVSNGASVAASRPMA